MQGAWRSHPSHANEAMDVDWMGSQTCEPVPANEIGVGECDSQLAISRSECVHSCKSQLTTLQSECPSVCVWLRLGAVIFSLRRLLVG